MNHLRKMVKVEKKYSYEALKDQNNNMLKLFASSVLPTAAAERALISLPGALQGAGKAAGSINLTADASAKLSVDKSMMFCPRAGCVSCARPVR